MQIISDDSQAGKPRRSRVVLLVFSKEKRKVPLLAASLQGCCPVRAIWGSLPCGRYLFAPLTWELQVTMGLMVHRVMSTPTRLMTNILYTLVENAPLHSILRV